MCIRDRSSRDPTCFNLNNYQGMLELGLNMPNKAIQPGTKRQASALQDTSRRLQQQHQDTVVREARIRLDSKKAFMDDEFYLSETSGFGAERTMNGMEYMSPANLRAVLKSGNPLAQIHKNAKTGGMRSSSGMTARGPEPVSYTHLDVYKRQYLFC